MNNGSDERQDAQQKHNNRKGGRLHVNDKLDTGNAECTKERHNMKKSRQGRIVLKGNEITKHGGPSSRVLTWRKQVLIVRRRLMV